MSSIVGRLARTLSQGNDRNDFGRPHLSDAKDVPQRSSSLKPRLSASPSFNDFSLRVEQDVEEELGSLMNSKASNQNLASLEMGEPSAPVEVPTHRRAFSSWSSLSPFGSSREEPSPELPPSPSANPASPSKYKRMKIMGMDPYDFCDLLRQGSL